MTLLELLALMRKHLRLVIILHILTAALTAAYAWLIMPDEYTASVSLYVLTSSGTQENTNALTNSDLSASQMLTNDVAELVKSDRVTGDSASDLGMSSLKGYKINVESQTTTRVITLSVTGESAQAVATVANALAKTTDKVAQEVMGVESVNVIDEAKAPTSPSGPNRVLYTIVAALAGLFVAIAGIVLADMLDTRVRTVDDAAEMLGLSVIGRIPVIED